MKEMIKKVRERREGFTMAELLIVVAIIAVLVAIAIPVFNAQLEKSRDSTDQANVRAAYAELSAALITAGEDGTDLASLGLASADGWSGSLSSGAGTIKKSFDGKGTDATWSNGNTTFKIGGITIDAVAGANTLTFVVTGGKITDIDLSKVTTTTP